MGSEMCIRDRHGSGATALAGAEPAAIADTVGLVPAVPLLPQAHSDAASRRPVPMKRQFISSPSRTAADAKTAVYPGSK